MKKTEPIRTTAEEIAKLYPDGDEAHEVCRITVTPEIQTSPYYCTRDKGHAGNHVGYGFPGKPLAMWRDKTLLWERSAK